MSNLTKTLVVLITITVLGAALFFMYSLSMQRDGTTSAPPPPPVVDVYPGQNPPPVDTPTPPPAVGQVPPSPVSGAKPALYFSPTLYSAQVGKTFSVPVMLDANRPVIAVTAEVSFNPADLDVVSVDGMNSIFPIQAENAVEKGRVKITRGKIPPGFIGVGRIVTITFKLKRAASGEILLDITTPGQGPSRAILDDGQGTDVLASVGTANYTTLY